MEKETPEHDKYNCEECRENMRDYSKETPDNRPEAVLDRILERAGAVPPETPTVEEFDSDKEIVGSDCMCVLGSKKHNPECEYAETTPTVEEWVQLEEIVLFVCETELSRIETALEVREKINALLSSHDAELARKIEGLLVKEYMKGSPAEYQNKILLAVLALLDNKNV